MIIRQSPIILVFRILTIEFAFSFIYLIIILAGNFIKSFDLSEISFHLQYDTVFFILFLILQLTTSIYILLRWYNDYYIINTENGIIIKKIGILIKKEERYPIKNIETVSLYQSFLGKLLDYGNITFYNPLIKQDLILMFIPDSIRISELIQKESIKPSGKNVFVKKS